MWHPFGPHGRETRQQILDRKAREISANGWTLWSFRYRRPEVLKNWSRLLAETRSPRVFCSDSARAVDPSQSGVPVTPVECQSFRLIDEDRATPMPPGVRVLHSFRNRKRCTSAFVVKK